MWIVTLILKYLPWVTRLTPALSFVRAKGRWLVLALILAMGAWIWWQGQQKDALREDLERTQQDLRICWSANTSNQTTIQRLRKANIDLSSALSASRADTEEIAENLRRKEAAARERLSRALGELEELKHENPTCEKLASVDFGAVCPDVDARLRRHAEASRSN